MLSKLFSTVSYRVILVVFVATTSCKDAALEEEVLNYCACIDDHKNKEKERWECIEMMQELQEKYQNKPRKLNALVEQTDACW